MTEPTKEQVIEILARGVAGKALGIKWEDTESQARMVATSCAEVLFALTEKALAVKTADSSDEYITAVNDLLEFIGVPVNG